MQAERMMEAMLKVNEMFQGAKRSMMEGNDDQMLPYAKSSSMHMHRLDTRKGMDVRETKKDELKN